MTKIQYFVKFFSPGTFFAEETMKPIDSWDVDKAVEMAGTISERYGATPYGFKFLTRSRGQDDLDSQQTESSLMYFLGGEIFTLQEIEDRADPKDSILFSNMRGNGWNKVIVNTNSWKITLPFEDDCVLLPYIPPENKSRKRE